MLRFPEARLTQQLAAQNAQGAQVDDASSTRRSLRARGTVPPADTSAPAPKKARSVKQPAKKAKNKGKGKAVSFCLFSTISQR